MYDTKIISKAVDLRNQGFTQKEIAIQLGCGERTVRRWFTGVNLQNLIEATIIVLKEVSELYKLKPQHKIDLIVDILICAGISLFSYIQQYIQSSFFKIVYCV